MKPSRRRRTFTLGLLAFLAALAPAWAGSVFVPISADVSQGGETFATKVWVSNPSGSGRRFNLAFIPMGTDGSAVTPDLTNLFVPAGGTVAVGGLVAPGKSGLLQVSGAPQLLVHARHELSGPTGLVQASATIPVISSANALAAGAVAELQGLERADHGVITNFALVNLALTPAQCSVSIFRSDKTQIGSTAVLLVPALSVRDFGEVMLLIGVPNVSDVRFEVSCDHQFFTYATVVPVGSPLAAFVTPSPSLAQDAVSGTPNSPGGGGPPPSGNQVTLKKPGVFLAATDADSEVDFTLDAPPGVAYKRATIDWDMHIGSFPNGLFTGVMSFRRPNDSRANRVVYAAIQVVNYKSKTVLDLGVDNVLVRSDTQWRENSDYHMKLVYDIGDVPGSVTLVISQGSTVLATLTGPPQHFDMSANDNPLLVNFGQTGIGDGAYFPPVTWTFSNLNLVLDPK